jgi:hypothetical protein
MRCGLGIILDRTSRAAPINDPPARTALKTRQPILKSYVSCGDNIPAI